MDDTRVEGVDVEGVGVADVRVESACLILTGVSCSSSFSWVGETSTPSEFRNSWGIEGGECVMHGCKWKGRDTLPPPPSSLSHHCMQLQQLCFEFSKARNDFSHFFCHLFHLATFCWLLRNTLERHVARTKAQLYSWNGEEVAATNTSAPPPPHTHTSAPHTHIPSAPPHICPPPTHTHTPAPPHICPPPPTHTHTQSSNSHTHPMSF